MVLQNISLGALHDLGHGTEATGLPALSRSTNFMARRATQGHPIALLRGAQVPSAALVLMPKVPALVGDRATLLSIAWWTTPVVFGALCNINQLRTLFAGLLRRMASTMSPDPKPEEQVIAPRTPVAESEGRDAFAFPCRYMVGSSSLTAISAAAVMRRAYLRSKNRRHRRTSRTQTTGSRNSIGQPKMHREVSETLSRQVSVQVATEGGHSVAPAAVRSKSKDARVAAPQEIALAGGLDRAAQPPSWAVGSDGKRHHQPDANAHPPAVESSEGVRSPHASSPVLSPSNLGRRRSTGNAGVGGFALPVPMPAPRRSRAPSLPNLWEEPSAGEFKRQETESIEESLHAFRAMLAARSSSPHDSNDDEEWSSLEDEEEESGLEDCSSGSRSRSSSSESYSDSSNEDEL
mmetsp:Transcript_6047/g.17282  ORF Transcript_6047/g.17282 Transcript_6047/m.17282 type:complete len:406 (+) Transcript_6047:81-1298(+)